MTKRKPKNSARQRELARLIDDTLTVLSARGPGDAVPLVSPPAPLPSLLERCEALLERGMINRPPMRIVHSFGGADDPKGVIEHLPNLRLIRTDFAEVAVAKGKFAGLLAEARGRAVETLIDGFDTVGGRLVLWHDHQFGRATPVDGVGRRMRAVVVVRHPLPTYLAARRSGGFAGTLEQFSQAYLAFVQAQGDLPRVKHEDFNENPGAALADLARALDLDVPDDLRPDDLRVEAASPPGPAAGGASGADAADLTAGPAYHAVCDLLTYPPEFAEAMKAVGKVRLAVPMAPVQWALLRPELPIVIACHHKSGTHFLRKVFDRIAAIFGLPLWMKFYDAAPVAGWHICFHQHSRITDLQAGRNFKGLHCVRHPKGLILSAALYHEKCAEPWVDVPLQRFTHGTFAALTDRDFYNVIKNPNTPADERERRMAAASTGAGVGPDFAGRSYRQMLQQAPTIEAKLLIELRSFSRGVILDMVRFPADRRFHQITLESISRDPEMNALRGAFDHLGFKGAALEKCLEIASQHTLWNVDTLPANATTGVSDDWRESFTGAAADEYQRLFGSAAEALGYVV